MSLLVALCFAFAALSAQASHKYEGVKKTQDAQIVLKTDSSKLTLKDAETYVIGVLDDLKKKPCTCKSGPAALVCGVALALTQESGTAPPTSARSRFSLDSVDGCSNVVYRLKRPPRTVL